MTGPCGIPAAVEGLPGERVRVSYVKEACSGATESASHVFTARLAYEGFEAAAFGPSGHAAYVRLLEKVRAAADEGLVASAAHAELADQSSYPPPDVYVRPKDGGRVGGTIPQTSDTLRALFLRHDEGLYRAGAELCLVNGGDPEKVVWWHNGEHAEPWGDCAQAAMDDAARIVTAFLEGEDKVLVDRGEYEEMLALKEKGRP